MVRVMARASAALRSICEAMRRLRWVVRKLRASMWARVRGSLAKSMSWLDGSRRAASKAAISSVAVSAWMSCS